MFSDSMSGLSDASAGTPTLTITSAAAPLIRLRASAFPPAAFSPAVPFSTASSDGTAFAPILRSRSRALSPGSWKTSAAAFSEGVLPNIVDSFRPIPSIIIIIT
jgi:hypothetical protein